jgi:hypothetical protein
VAWQARITDGLPSASALSLSRCVPTRYLIAVQKEPSTLVVRDDGELEHDAGLARALEPIQPCGQPNPSAGLDGAGGASPAHADVLCPGAVFRRRGETREKP